MTGGLNNRRIVDRDRDGARDAVYRQDLDQRFLILKNGRITLSLDALRAALGIEAIAAQAAAGVTIEPTTTEVDVFAGAGADGLVPDPGSETGLFLRDDGTWAAAGGGGGVPTSRLISTTAPLSGGGDLTTDRTLSLLDDGVTNSKLANMANGTYKARITAGTGDPEDIPLNGTAFPTSPAPIDGQLFYRTDLSTYFFWHATYAAWLSVNTYELDYGWASTVATSTYFYFFQGTGAARFTSSNGHFFGFATVVVGITIRPSTPTTGLTAQVRANGSNVTNAFVNTTGAGARNSKENIQTSAVIAADALISVFNTGASGTGSTSGGGKIRLRRREV